MSFSGPTATRRHSGPHACPSANLARSPSSFPPISTVEYSLNTQSALFTSISICVCNTQVNKLTIPCKKSVYRLRGRTGEPLMDVIQRASEPAPVPGERMLCRHPFEEQKRAHVVPTRSAVTVALVTCALPIQIT